MDQTAGGVTDYRGVDMTEVTNEANHQHRFESFSRTIEWCDHMHYYCECGQREPCKDDRPHARPPVTLTFLDEAQDISHAELEAVTARLKAASAKVSASRDERVQRYAEAIDQASADDGRVIDWTAEARAVIAVADAEQAELWADFKALAVQVAETRRRAEAAEAGIAHARAEAMREAATLVDDAARQELGMGAAERSILRRADEIEAGR